VQQAGGNWFRPSVGQVTEIRSTAAGSNDTVLDDPGVSVGFVDLGASSIDVTIVFDTKPADGISTRGGVRRAIYEALHEAGIDLPYQTGVVQKGEGGPRQESCLCWMQPCCRGRDGVSVLGGSAVALG